MTPSDVKIVAENINDFIEVPDGINRLRKAVLTLAMSGQLVEQDKNEGTARDLYTQIQSDRKKNENIGRKKQTKELLPITDEEIPFSIPESWKWVRLGEIMTISSGDSLKVKDATEGQYLVYGGNGIAGKHSSCNARKGTIVIGRVGALCGTAHIVESDAWVTDNAFIVSYSDDFVNKDFFTLALNFLNLRSNHRGSAQPVISGISVYPILMPLPPLAEQDRIVNKVHSVMAQLNELELQKKERDAFRSRLTRSAMQALGSADSKIAFEQLTQLVKTNSDVDELEKAIRSLSVFGYLTNKPTQEDIPADWKWTDWGDLLSGDKYSMKRGPFGSALRKDFFVPDGIKVYEQYNAIHDVDRERYFISEEKYKELEAFTVRPGDLIISCSGTLGRIAELHKDSKIGVINQALLKITLNKKLISNEYFILLFRSDFIQKRIYEEALGTAMTNMVNVKTLKKIALPIPPLKEQQQIVKKFNELKRMLDNL